MPGRLTLVLIVHGLHHERQRARHRGETVVGLAAPQPRGRHAGEVEVELLLCTLRHLHALGAGLLLVCHGAVPPFLLLVASVGGGVLNRND